MDGLSTAFQALIPRQGWGILSTGSALVMAGSTALALANAFTIKEIQKRKGNATHKSYTKLEPSLFLIPMVIGGMVSTFSNLSFPLTDSQCANFSALFVPSLSGAALLAAGLGLIAFFRNQTVKDAGGSVDFPLGVAVVLGGFSAAMILGTVKLPESSWWNSTALCGYGAIGSFIFGMTSMKVRDAKRAIGVMALFSFLSTTLGARWANLAFNNLHQSLKAAGLYPPVQG